MSIMGNSACTVPTFDRSAPLSSGKFRACVGHDGIIVDTRMAWSKACRRDIGMDQALVVCIDATMNSANTFSMNGANNTERRLI